MTSPSRIRAVSADEAVSHIRSGMKVFLHGACATPTPLVEALVRREDLENVSLYHLHTAGPAPFADPGMEDRFTSYSLFTGPPLREAVGAGRAESIPVFLSDIPRLFKSRRIPLDAALVQLSTPDVHGLCSLGPSVDTALAATWTAPIVVAEINEQMPRTLGRTSIPFSSVTAYTSTDRPLHEHPPSVEGEVEGAIGDLIAELVSDGDCLQMGVGSIPDAVLRRLGDRNDLGVHTEMFSDSVVDLMEAGNITNRRKEIHAGRTTTSFVAGTKRLFDFVHDNPLVEFHPCDRTNDTNLIRKNDGVVAINSAIEVDLTGQVCADSIGHQVYSGIGGQMDFIRGAAESRGGKPIIALPATARGGTVSRITPELRPGAGVVTTRGHVHWVVTEYGAVDLHGLSLRDRAAALISIAHPDVRPELRDDYKRIRNQTV